LVLAVGCLGLSGGRSDWLVEKATELGAAALVPLVTERSSGGSVGGGSGNSSGGGGAKRARKFRMAGVGGEGDSGGDSGDFRPAGRLGRLAAAALKQSQRAHGLELRPPAPLAELVPAVGAAPLAIVATGGAPPMLVQMRQHAGGDSGGDSSSRAGLFGDGAEWWLFVGPEGDFTPSELDALRGAGALPAGLGPHRLRTETAALALLAAAAAFADARGR
jgi:16S rRNA (uracil1498-N3)-methyltransferase